nr:sugar phosphate isomerase/epimerase [Rubellimicrobium arenae]
MLGPDWRGRPDELIDAIAAAGYAGIEITDNMIGHYREDPDGFARALDGRGLALAALAVVSPTGFTEIDQEKADVEALRPWVDFAARFPGAVISLGSATVVSDGPREDKFAVAAAIYNRVAQVGAAAGVEVAVHPSSHHNTLLLTREDYDQLFGRLDGDLVGWVPDTGHILRGHADMLDTLRTYRDRIRYLHLKDADAQGHWAMLGQGLCDIQAVLGICEGAPRFNGWVVVEEESDEAAADPAAAVKRNRRTMESLGL